MQLRDEYASAAESTYAVCTSVAWSESDPELAREINTLAAFQRNVANRLDDFLAENDDD